MDYINLWVAREIYQDACKQGKVLAGRLVATLTTVLLFSTGRFAAAPAPAQITAGSRSTSDPQLESLLKIKSIIDKADHLKSWTRESGVNFGYCTDPQLFLGFCAMTTTS